MMFGQWPESHKKFKRLAKALIRLLVCWSEPLLDPHATLLEISCPGSYLYERTEQNQEITLFKTFKNEPTTCYREKSFEMHVIITDCYTCVKCTKHETLAKLHRFHTVNPLYNDSVCPQIILI